MSAIAAIVDYGIVPKRLTPGWELSLSKKSMAGAFASPRPRRRRLGIAAAWFKPEKFRRVVIPCFCSSSALSSIALGLEGAASPPLDVRCHNALKDFQRMWIDTGEVLPVTSSSPPEMRQAATPKHAVSVKAATSRSIQENWLTPWPPQTKLNFG